MAKLLKTGQQNKLRNDLSNVIPTKRNEVSNRSLLLVVVAGVRAWLSADSRRNFCQRRKVNFELGW